MLLLGEEAQGQLCQRIFNAAAAITPSVSTPTPKSRMRRNLGPHTRPQPSLYGLVCIVHPTSCGGPPGLSMAYPGTPTPGTSTGRLRRGGRRGICRCSSAGPASALVSSPTSYRGAPPVSAPTSSEAQAVRSAFQGLRYSEGLPSPGLP